MAYVVLAQAAYSATVHIVFCVTTASLEYTQHDVGREIVWEL